MEIEGYKLIEALLLGEQKKLSRRRLKADVRQGENRLGVIEIGGYAWPEI